MRNGSVKETAAEARGCRATDLHLLLQLIREDSVELLNVMLHERVERLPSERLGKFVGAYRITQREETEPVQQPSSSPAMLRERKATNRRTGPMSEGCRRHAVMLVLRFLTAYRLLSGFGRRPENKGSVLLAAAQRSYLSRDDD
jgi:hypothetical protein